MSTKAKGASTSSSTPEDHNEHPPERDLGAEIEREHAELKRLRAEHRAEAAAELRSVLETVRGELGLDKMSERFISAVERSATALERIARELEQGSVNRTSPPASPAPPPAVSPARVHRNVPATIRKHLPPL